MIKNYFRRKKYEWHLDKIERLSKLPPSSEVLNQMFYHEVKLNILSGLAPPKSRRSNEKTSDN